MLTRIKRLIDSARKNEMISLVFFVGRGRTHDTYLSSRKALLLVLLVTGSLVSGLIVSSALVANYRSNVSRGKSLVERGMALFSYQVTYEHVYESAYEIDSKHENQNQPAEFQQSIIEEPDSWKTNLVSPFFYLQKLSFSNDVNKVDLNFTLINTSGAPIQGYTWGVAKIRRSDGSIYLQGVPQDKIILDPKGHIIDYTLATEYRFKSRWRHTYSFQTHEVGDSLLTAYVFFADMSGHLTSHYKFETIGPNPIMVNSH